MKRGVWGRRVVLAAACLAVLTQGCGARAAETGGTVPPSSARPAAQSTILHRVVWDDSGYRRGIHLRSANPQGTDVRRLYDYRRGFTTDLTLDRAGRRVAFATCCRAAFPALVVVPVEGGSVRRPLAHHLKIFFVGGIGWSADGRRLAFEGTERFGTGVRTSLWTIRPSGRALRHVLTLRRGGQPFINEALAWTSAGILYSDGTDLRRAWAGRSSLVLRHVQAVRISGDGRSMITRRFLGGEYSFWTGGPNGTGQHELFAQGDPGRETTYFKVTPRYDGVALLALRSAPGSDGTPSTDDIVTWTTGASPTSAVPVTTSRGTFTATWN